MKKGQVVKDIVSGKKFALGKSGIKGLVERVSTYAEQQGQGEVLLKATASPLGRTFTVMCTKCNTRFTIAAGNKLEKYENFQQDCMTHARACGAGAGIVPVR